MEIVPSAGPFYSMAAGILGSMSKSNSFTPLFSLSSIIEGAL